MIECPHCGDVPRRGSRACARCGWTLPDLALESETAPEAALVAIIADDTPRASAGPRFAGGVVVAAPVRPPGMPVVSRDSPEPVTAPGAFMAAWELPAQVKQRKLLRWKRNRKWARRGIALALLGVAAFVAYPRVHTMIIARSVAPDLRGYVEGQGVSYAAPDEGYTVRLPKLPARSAPPLVAASIAAPMATHASVVVGSDYRIAIWDGALPGGSLPRGAYGALKDPKIGGRGTLAAVRSMRIGGETAYVGTFTSSDALPRRVAVMVHGGRLFVIRTQAESAGTVFDAVADSFRFSR